MLHNDGGRGNTCKRDGICYTQLMVVYWPLLCIVKELSYFSYFSYCLNGS